MSEKIILRYLPMLFNNLYNNSNQPDKKQGIQQILSMTMIRDSFRIIGFRNIYPSWKEYLFYLAMKFKFTRLVCYEYNKIFTPEKVYNKCQIIEAHYILNSLHKPSVVFMVIGTLCSYTYCGTSTFTKVRSDDSRGGKFMFPT